LLLHELPHLQREPPMNFRFLARRRPTPADVAANLTATRPILPPVVTAPAVAVPAPPVTVADPRATYRVHFDGSVPDLIAHKVTRRELAAAAVGHVRPYARATHAVIDAQMPFILVRADDSTVARATFEVLPTGGGQR
ncbi:hypothetical protein V2S66_34350, partial [Streptomyces sp. V4-01]|nr:hypothetical protein [Streptomyces sp. V4-01]